VHYPFKIKLTLYRLQSQCNYKHVLDSIEILWKFLILTLGTLYMLYIPLLASSLSVTVVICEKSTLTFI